MIASIEGIRISGSGLECRASDAPSRFRIWGFGLRPLVVQYRKV